jgi:hypothetical protein
MSSRYVAYILLDESGNPVYVGVGYDGAWDTLYTQRNVARNSELTRWLLSLDKQPAVKRLISIPIPLRAAKAFAESERARLHHTGIRLLSAKAQDRAANTYAPGGSKRLVRSPSGMVYPSVRAAAQAVGVTSTSVVGWCKSGRNGWRYADDSESRFNVPNNFELLQ